MKIEVPKSTSVSDAPAIIATGSGNPYARSANATAAKPTALSRSRPLLAHHARRSSRRRRSPISCSRTSSATDARYRAAASAFSPGPLGSSVHMGGSGACYRAPRALARTTARRRLRDMTIEIDWHAFEQLAARYRAGEIRAAPEQAFEPLQPGDVTRLPDRSTPEGERCRRLGEEAFRGGAVASVVVAGGAGTRFGGGVKGLVPLLGDRSFLDLKLADARRAGARFGTEVPVAIMTSPLTHEEIAAYLRSVGAPDVLLFQQRM